MCAKTRRECLKRSILFEKPVPTFCAHAALQAGSQQGLQIGGTKIYRRMAAKQ
jgi:hypothetical protein